MPRLAKQPAVQELDKPGFCCAAFGLIEVQHRAAAPPSAAVVAGHHHDAVASDDLTSLAGRIRAVAGQPPACAGHAHGPGGLGGFAAGHRNGCWLRPGRATVDRLGPHKAVRLEALGFLRPERLARVVDRSGRSEQEQRAIGPSAQGTEDRFATDPVRPHHSRLRPVPAAVV